MAPVTHPGLQPKLDLSPDDLEALSVNGFGPTCTPTLMKTGWKKLATGNIGIALASDNKRILAANLFLLGRLHKLETDCLSVSAAKFWPGIDPKIELRFPFDKLDIFPFDSTLQSGLIDGSAAEHEIFNTSTGLPVSSADFIEAGGSGFTLRAFAHMTAGVWLKLQIVLYPMAKVKLLESFPFASNVDFPGLLLTSKSITMLPNATKDYGLPFYPFLLKGRPDASFPQMSTFDLRSKMAALLLTGSTPKLAKDAAYLGAKWDKLKDLGDKGEESLTCSSTSAPAWPDARPTPPLDSRDESSDLEGMYLSFQKICILIRGELRSGVFLDIRA